jgi:hypothetical protein
MGAGQQTYGGEFGVLPRAHANAGVFEQALAAHLALVPEAGPEVLG